MFFQIFLIIFAVVALVRTYGQYKKAEVSMHWFWVWFVLWAVVIAVAISPQTTDIIAKFVGVERGADLLVYIAIVVLLYGFARILVAQERQRKEMTELIRTLAIDHGKKDA